MKLDRGADFISTVKRQSGRLLLRERGSRRRDAISPCIVSGTQSEYAADCHISGALSEYG